MRIHNVAAVIVAFLATLPAPLVAAPTISSVAKSPAAPTNFDSVVVTASVQPSPGTTISQVQLSYGTGAVTTSTVFRETMTASPNNAWNGTGAQNPWTVTALRAGGDVRQRATVANHTVPVVVANCTTYGTTTVTCASTAGLWPGMLITGPNIAAGTTISTVPTTTTFTINPAATGSGPGLSLTAAGVTLTNCSTTATSPNVSCDSNVGLITGMGVNATTNPPNPTVSSLIGLTGFALNSNASATTTTPITLTASGCGVEMSNGTATYTDTMFAMSTSLNASAASSGYVEFYVRTANHGVGNGWTFQISSDGGATWTTRVSETATNHAFTLKHYDLAPSELTANLRMRFQSSGSTTPPAPLCDIDDILISLTTGNPPTTLTMFDDGAHGDGAVGDGVFGATIPVQAGGTTVTYSVKATDNTAASTTSSDGSYTVVTVSPALAVSPAGGFTTGGAIGGPFSPASAAYTLSNTGTGSLNWTAGKTAGWLSLSATAGTIPAGGATVVTATPNTNANALAAGGYSDTITFANTTNAVGNTTRGVSLTAYTVPAAPTLAAGSYGRGTNQTISWAAIPDATSYTIQISTVANFSSVLATQTVTGAKAGFINLVEGATYYYRVLATNPAGSSGYSNIIAITPDATAPAVAITSPATGTTTTAATIAVTGTSSDALSGVASVKVNNVAATTTNNFATWSATVPLGFGTNAITATATDRAGNFTTTAPRTVTVTTAQTYNPLYIPDTMTGTTFNLTLDQSSKRFFAGNATNTYGYNRALFWGPTLIMKKGDFVRINLTNNLIDTTTTHWHGFHIPAIMDGGPHQTIPPGTTWSPSFHVRNDAATYWYHPHLHTTTQAQVTMGGGGLIIVQDDEEAALPLPRTYGVDDIPLVLTSRRVAGQGAQANQFALNGAFGDFMLVNGTLNPQVSLPAQVVRLRILNAEVARNHNLGFSDNRTFYVIATDGGLLNAPVPVTRMVMGSAERYEILVDLRDLAPGSSLDLMTYNSNQPAGYSGGQAATTGANGSLLNNIDFVDLHINIAAPTANPITSIPATLAHHVYWTNADVTNNRTVQLTGVGGNPLSFDNLVYSPSVINQTVNFNAVEQWTWANVSNLAHTVHIHDIQFYLTSMPGGVPAYMQGWKDSFIVPQQSSVSFIAKFDDFASNSNPFMFHCHFLQHEDAGLMGQFLVKNNAVEDLAVASFTRVGSEPMIHLQFKATPGTTYIVQYSPDMTTGSWLDVGSITSDGTSGDFYETDPARLGQARGFYRVTMPVISE